MNDDVKYLMQQMQVQKVIGELNVLRAAFYDPMTSAEHYKEKSKIIDSIISELENELG